MVYKYKTLYYSNIVGKTIIVETIRTSWKTLNGARSFNNVMGGVLTICVGANVPTVVLMKGIFMTSDCRRFGY